MTGVELQIKTKPVLPNNVVVTNFTGLELIFNLPVPPRSIATCDWYLPGTQNDSNNFPNCYFASNCLFLSGCDNWYNYTSNCKERGNGTTTGYVTFPRLVQPFLEPMKNYIVDINCSDPFSSDIQAQYSFIILGEYYILPLLRLRLNTTQMLYLTLN